MLRTILAASMMLKGGVLPAQDTLRKIGREALASWRSLDEAGISPDGKHVFYTVRNTGELVVTSAAGGKKQVFLQAASPAFSEDGSTLYFKKGADSTGILSLRSGRVTYMPAFERLGKWRVSHAGSGADLNVTDGARSMTFREAAAYYTNKQHRFLAIVVAEQGRRALIRVDLRDGSRQQIATAPNFVTVAMSDDGEKCAYVTSDTSYDHRTLSIYEHGVTDVVLKESAMTGDFRRIDGTLRFNASGTILFIRMMPQSNQPEKKMEVWSYLDRYLPAQEGAWYQQRKKEYLLVAYTPASKRFVTLNDKGRILAGDDRFQQYAVLAPASGTPWFDQAAAKDSIYLIYPASGHKVNLFPASMQDYYFLISPDERFVCWFDRDSLQWRAYEVASGKTRTISGSIPYPLHDQQAMKIGRRGTPGMAGWTGDGILLYDEFDIWEVKLNGSAAPVNVTNGFGRKHGLTMSLVEQSYPYIVRSGETMIVAGYDRNTKQGGYWKIVAGRSPVFEEGHLFPYSVRTRMPIGNYGSAEGTAVKAANADVYLVLREDAQTSRNAFVTTDFKRYTAVSDIHPERSYNWMTAELVTTQAPDGCKLQGIIYKPGNFDASKRYPVIFNYYEKRSDELHLFHLPRFSQHNLNIPLFTDNGYLVFVQDIDSHPGHNGEGTYGSLEAARKYVCALPYVDTARLGLQGHSYGGWQTNYMITRSHHFAAACEAAGVSNQVSGYGQLSYGSKKDRQRFYEEQSQGSPYGYGITPWTNPGLYIDNSPVFRIGNVTTPLLMMHNRDDDSVPYEQALEFFLGLRRAGKPAWMLTYEGGHGHMVSGEAAEDFHRRMMEFFDHYLKGKPAPAWMTGRLGDEVAAAPDWGKTQYHSLVAAYEEGQRGHKFLEAIVREAWIYQDMPRLKKVTEDYFTEATDEELNTKASGDFVRLMFYAKDDKGFFFDTTLVRRRYISLLQAYRASGRYAGAVARLAKELRDTATAGNVFRAHISQWTPAYKLTKEDAELLIDFTKRATDAGFAVLFPRVDEARKVLGGDRAEGCLTAAIERSEIKPFIDGAKANWDSAAARTRKFGALGEEILMQSQVLHGVNNSQCELFNKVADTWYAKYGSRRSWVRTGFLNTVAWMLFLRCDMPEVLKTAIAWSKITVEQEPIPMYYDTYANLLYKTGQVEEALRIQEAGLAMPPGAENREEMIANFDKMKKGTPTWK